MPTEYYCDATEDHVHVIDFNSITQAHIAARDPSALVVPGFTDMLMDLCCKACGRSGSFRMPKVSEIDW